MNMSWVFRLSYQHAPVVANEERRISESERYATVDTQFMCIRGLHLLQNVAYGRSSQSPLSGNSSIGRSISLLFVTNDFSTIFAYEIVCEYLVSLNVHMSIK